MNDVNNVTVAFPDSLEFENHGWKIKDIGDKKVLVPIWDKEENRAKFKNIMNIALIKCGCKKTGCDPNQRRCKCVKFGSSSTSLCGCVGCTNSGSNSVSLLANDKLQDENEQTSDEDEEEDENENEDEEEDDEEGCVNDKREEEGQIELDIDDFEEWDNVGNI